MDVNNNEKNFLKNEKIEIMNPPEGGGKKKLKDIVPFYWGKFN